MELSIGTILLAAGGSERMGRPKQLLPFAGTTLLRRAALTALATRFTPVVVVLGAAAEACRAEIGDLAVVPVEHGAWREGMGSSLRAGVEALEKIAPDTSAALVLLHDQPLIEAAALHKLAALWRLPQAPIAAAFYGGNPGVPAIFGREFFPELKIFAGTEGAKKTLLRHADRMALLDLPEAAEDIDSPADYRRLAGD